MLNLRKITKINISRGFNWFNLFLKNLSKMLFIDLKDVFFVYITGLQTRLYSKYCKYIAQVQVKYTTRSSKTQLGTECLVAEFIFCKTGKLIRVKFVSLS